MSRSFFNLVDQSFYFPQAGFEYNSDQLFFHGLPLMDLVQQFGSPLRFTYLPKIDEQIAKARLWFADAFRKNDYKGQYHYAYCTKSSHLKPIVERALNNGSQLELSSANDVAIVLHLEREGLISKDRFIICNGFKTVDYIEGIKEMIECGFHNVIPVVDNIEEMDFYDKMDVQQLKLGVRVATEEDPNFELYTSRFGVRQIVLEQFIKDRIASKPKFSLNMVHFFIYTGVQDNSYYWSEVNKCLKSYCQLKTICPELNSLNLGGGLPVQDSLDFNFDYPYMIDELVKLVKQSCDTENIAHPDLFTEFGRFTVAESSGIIYKVIGTKSQNDRESWYILDNSIMNNLPDIWGMNKKFILLPLNHWKVEYQKVILGGLTCDNDDFYDSISSTGSVYLPKIEKDSPPLYIGFFHTGAYQANLSGVGGAKHCLIPEPQLILVDQDNNGKLTYSPFKNPQNNRQVLRQLGYNI